MFGISWRQAGSLCYELAEAAGVPEFVAEVAPQLDVLLVVEHVLAERGAAHDAEPERVGAVVADELERVGRIAEALRHLAALLVADDPGEMDVLVRNLANRLVAGPGCAGSS